MIVPMIKVCVFIKGKHLFTILINHIYLNILLLHNFIRDINLGLLNQDMVVLTVIDYKFNESTIY